MKVLAIVPARAGSKRVPGKNLRTVGGKPLVAWAIEAATGARRVARTVVSSDDPEILRLAGPLALARPADLAGDESPAIDYVRHALATLGDFDAVAIVQPSSPLTRAADVDATLELLETSGADSAVTVVRLAHDVHPLKMKVLDGDRLLPYLEDERGRMAAHELPPIFVRNCAVYATRRAVVEAGAILGADCRGHVMPRERSVDINDELDLAFAEFLLGRQG